MIRAWVFENIDRYQLKQFEHDADSHSDLASALLPKRMTHFTLHFSKYQGVISDCIKRENRAILEKTLVDTMIITLAASNAMNFCVSERLQEIKLDQVTTCDGGKNAIDSYLIEYVSIVGKMAKACEVLDHLEAYPSRKILEDSVVKLIALTDAISCDIDFNIWNHIEKRWAEVEDKYVINKLKKKIL